MPTPQPAKEGVRPSTAPQCEDQAASLTKRPLPPPDYAPELRKLLPRELREQRRFIVFEVVQDPETGKYGKLGKIAGTEINARSNTPADWATFEEAARDGRALGIAMGDELAGVDLDDCFSGDDELSPWAKTIVETMNSYTERSVSGHGLHVLCLIADVPAELLNDDGRPTFKIFPSSLLQPGTTGQIEVYAGSHFMTLTGDVNSRERIERRDDEFAALASDLATRRRRAQEARWTAAAATWASIDHEFAACQLSDEEVNAKLAADSISARHWNADGGSESDFGLLAKLAFYGGGNENQMERLLCASPRGSRIRHGREMRDDLRYVRSSIVKVMAGWSGGFYNPQAYVAAKREAEGAGKQAAWTAIRKPSEPDDGGWGVRPELDAPVATTIVSPPKVAFRFIGVGDLLAKDWPAPRPLVSDHRGRLLAASTDNLLIHADKRTGKTWLTLDLGLCFATGQPFLGRLPVADQMKTVFIEAEGTANSFQNRMQKLCAARGIDAASLDGWLSFSIANEQEAGVRFALDDPESVRMLIDQLRDDPPGVLFIDPLRRFHLQDENTQQGAATLVNACDIIRQELGCLVCLSHHDVKGDQYSDKSKRAAGNAHLANSMGVISLTKKSKGDYAFTMEVSCSPKEGLPIPDFDVRYVLRDGEDAQGEPEPVIDRIEVRGIDGHSHLSPQQRTIIRAVSDSPGLSYDELAGRCGVGKSRLRHTMPAMESLGLVVATATDARGTKAFFPPKASGWADADAEGWSSAYGKQSPAPTACTPAQ